MSIVQYQWWVWEKRDVHKLVHGDNLKKQYPLLENYCVLKATYWLCAGGISAVNVIGAPSRGVMNSGFDPMAVGGIYN